MEIDSIKKINKPCYFYNTGGCYNIDGTEKKEEDCKYLHIKIIEPLEKPQHLKAPCKYYHLRGYCSNRYCIFGHSELSEDRWKKYFPSKNYPGVGYCKDFKLCFQQPNSPLYSDYDVNNHINSTIQSKFNTEIDINQIKKTLLMLMMNLVENPDS